MPCVMYGSTCLTMSNCTATATVMCFDMIVSCPPHRTRSTHTPIFAHVNRHAQLVFGIPHTHNVFGYVKTHTQLSCTDVDPQLHICLCEITYYDSLPPYSDIPQHPKTLRLLRRVSSMGDGLPALHNEEDRRAWCALFGRDPSLGLLFGESPRWGWQNLHLVLHSQRSKALDEVEGAVEITWQQCAVPHLHRLIESHEEVRTVQLHRGCTGAARGGAQPRPHS